MSTVLAQTSQTSLTLALQLERWQSRPAALRLAFPSTPLCGLHFKKMFQANCVTCAFLSLHIWPKYCKGRGKKEQFLIFSGVSNKGLLQCIYVSTHEVERHLLYTVFLLFWTQKLPPNYTCIVLGWRGEALCFPSACLSCHALTCASSVLRLPQVIGFSSETVAAFIAVVGILSILAQVLKNSPIV